MQPDASSYAVLLLGVSEYLHLPEGGGAPAERSFRLKQLSSTARSAFGVYEWLLAHRDQLPLPLATIRLLLAPSTVELESTPQMAGLGALPTRSTFAAAAIDWRRDARLHSDGMTLFYFAGHGVQRRKGDSVMLLHDFGDPTDGPLAKTVAFNNLYHGMAPPRSIAQNKMAKRQVYFVDACRMAPTEFQPFEWMNISDIFQVELGGVDDRVSPIFFSSLAGAKAYAIRGEQTLFCRALLNCLDGSAAEVWTTDGQDERRAVTVHSLNTTLEKEIEALREEHGGDQDYHPIVGKNTLLCYVAESPQPEQRLIEVQVEVRPEAVASFVHLRIQDADDAVVLDREPPLLENPLMYRLPEGFYQILAQVGSGQPAATNFEAWVRVREPGAVQVRVDL